MAYMITYNGYLKDINIAVYAEKAMATQALNTISDPAISGLVVDAEADVVGSNKFLADLFNALHTVEDPAVVERFSQKSEGQRRLYARIQNRAQGQPVLSVEVAPTEAEAPQQESDMKKAKNTKKAKAAKAPKAAKTSSGGSRSRIDKTKKLRVNVDENPLRAGSAAYDRFKIMKTGMTVATAIDKGVWLADIRHCVKKKFISLTD